MSMHPSPQAIRPRTWWLAALLTVVLAVISAGGLVLLAWGWYLVLPVWSILILVIAGTFFRRQPGPTLGTPLWYRGTRLVAPGYRVRHRISCRRVIALKTPSRRDYR